MNIVPANFYSEIPLIDEIENSFEYTNPGEEVYNNQIFDSDRIAAFIDSLLPYAKEFTPQVEGDTSDPDAFFWKNPAFSYSDAMAYYCILRSYKPDHVLEIGSGFSTFVADQALQRNGKGKITIIEPYPKKFLMRLNTVDEIIQEQVQNIPVPALVNLVESSDIWFIDSTHTVKIGSDCLYIYLQIMPKVSKELLVHSHDVFLPYAASKKNALEKHVYWTEQYLLYAYMLDNPKIEVLYGSMYGVRKMPELMEKFMAGQYLSGGGSIWYRLKIPSKG